MYGSEAAAELHSSSRPLADGEPLEQPPAGSWAALQGLLLSLLVLLDFVFKQIWYQTP